MAPRPARNGRKQMIKFPTHKRLWWEFLSPQALCIEKKYLFFLGENGCTGNTITFTPEAGKDYEVAPISTGRNCGVSVYEIH
ncbi:hypothetical protein BWD09_09855 [Neisseria dentiae]|uniref:Uncharacterized protein n=1 Tax=Neisseria dentiae TaxID=194197 RepID=A0A1X3D4T1_9NEIS|nr:hypothetical protein BWD09_09855 [Neisseria dentiae]